MPTPDGANAEPDPTLVVRFRKETGEEYDAELGVLQPMRLVDGQVFAASQLQLGDEIGGTGHVVVGLT